ncbi:MAG: hypothetical protein R3F61_25415 [Myxococcota bacterium]
MNRFPSVLGSLTVAALLAGCPGKDEDTDTDPVGCDSAPGCVVAEELAAGLLSVRVVADDDVWIVGASPEPSDGTGPVAVQWDGTAWNRVDTSAYDGTEIWWTWVTASEAVFVGSQGLVLELDRGTGTLTRVTGPDAGITFFGVWGASGDDLWAVGMSAGGSGPPALWRRQAGTWAAWEDPVLGPGADGETYFKVHGTAANDVWIVGDNGIALHWDGAALVRVPTDAQASTATAPLLTVDVGGTRPVAVGGAGNGLVLEYDGTDWLDLSPAFVPGFNGVCSGPGGAAVAVGQYGLRAIRQSDGSWASASELSLTPLTQEDWHSCAISPSGAVWAVGGHISSRPLDAGVVSYQGPNEPLPLSL